MPYHWLDFTPPQPQIAAAPVEDFVTAASIPVRQIVDSAQEDHIAAAGGQVAYEVTDQPKLVSVGDFALRRRLVAAQAEGVEIGQRAEGDDAPPAQMGLDDRERNLKGVVARIADVVDLLARRQDRIGLLDDIIDLELAENLMTQPCAQHRLVRQHVARKPKGSLLLGLVHSKEYTDERIARTM